MESGRQSQRNILSMSVLLAIVSRPNLWVTAIRQVLRLAPTGWWKRLPHLPLPGAEYLEFRLVTQYGGDPATQMSKSQPLDVVDYLRWCRDWNRTR
ncbi:MAG: hypothetical protein JHD14_02040 [Ilumatobacteraceae bacterium]|jgi:hypothetical protein|nr:hypothetical protein [Ilumatobacteraceae bacterium]MBJ7487131.1 hypothetical protein [Ilumatobacteraceae bacterium]